MNRVFSTLLLVSMAAGTAAATERYRALLVEPEEEWRLVAKDLAKCAEFEGYATRTISLDDLTDPLVLAGNPDTLLLLPDASALPMGSVGPIQQFLGSGGKMIALNTPMWQRPLLKSGDEWVTREVYHERHASNLMERCLFPFSSPLDVWTRSSNDPSHPAEYTVVPVEAPAFAQALHARIGLIDSWDTLQSPPLEAPFADDHEMTVFWAKGGPVTTELSIEWRERDGSRWIAAVPLSSEWRQYVLGPEAFRYWESVPFRQQSRFDPAEAAACTIGLARTHTVLIGDAHEYWVGPFGTARRTPIHEKLVTNFQAPALPILSPAYKFYPSSRAVVLRNAGSHHNLLVHELYRSLEPHEFQFLYPRPTANGFDKGRDWRWMPLYTGVTDETYPIPLRYDPVHLGCLGTLWIQLQPPAPPAAWVSIPINSQRFIRERILDEMRPVIRLLRNGLFFMDGGVSMHTVPKGWEELLESGVRVVNASSSEAPWSPGHCSGGGRRMVNYSEPAKLPQDLFPLPAGMVGHSYLCSTPLDLPSAAQSADGAVAGQNAPLHVLSIPLPTSEDEVHGDTCDRIWHEFHTHAPPADPDYVTVADGRFMRGGKPWRPHGVNYMPSSGIGVEDHAYFEYWMGAESYDPFVVSRDLQRVRAMGLDAVSVFIYHRSLEANNLFDFLRQCERLDLKVNLSLRPGTPMDFEWDKIRALLEYYRIAEYDTVFALDLAWEPMFRDHETRRRWDADWRAWVLERYGSVEDAERDWGFQGPRDEQGRLTNPLPHMTVDDGDWRVMVAAYRRFLDTLLYHHYRRAYDLVRTVDPHHLISFRMAESGNPTFEWGGAIPYDWHYLPAAVDFLAPEAYGRIGDWEKVKPGWFTRTYARWAAPHLPMLWAEAGVSVWVNSTMRAPQERLDYQGQYYSDLYRMFIGSGADGIFFWWYPGGYRVNERSDYGIINPDGSDRPVTRVIREHARAFQDAPYHGAPTVWLEMDRDRHPAGIAGTYRELASKFWDAVEAGETPGLRTPGTGSTSADCPLLAVGNVPYNGRNPLKYLDGYFDLVEVRNAQGQWERIASGNSVSVRPGEPIQARLRVVNLNEAAWLPGPEDAKGTVHLRLEGSEVRRRAIPQRMNRFDRRDINGILLLDVMPDAPRRITITLEAIGRGCFGPRHEVLLTPETKTESPRLSQRSTD